MSKEVTLRIGDDNILELSCNDKPLPEELENALKSQMTYWHKSMARGAAVYDPITGETSKIQLREKRMYRIDRYGRLVCADGFLYRLRRVIPKYGFRLKEVDIRTKVREPENRYKVDWEHMFDILAKHGKDLRARQDELLACMEQVDKGQIDAPPGFGKSFLFILYALAHPRARIHILVDGIDIMKRIFRTATKFLPSVGFVGDGKCDFRQVTVISIDSAKKIHEGFSDLMDRRAPDVVLCDEGHRLAADTALEVLRRYRRCKMYVFSASLQDRFDGAGAELEPLFGEVIFRMTYQEAQALGLVVPMRVDWTRICGPDPVGNVKSDTQKNRLGLWTHENRNRQIAAKIAEFPEDTQILVMVASIEHAVHLRQFLPDFALCYDKIDPKDYAYYVREGMLDRDRDPMVSPRMRDRMREDFEDRKLLRVIATDVWSTGVDFESLEVVVRADGRASKILDIQIPGRATRVDTKSDSKAYGIVVDCYDEFNRTFEYRSKSRKASYQKYGWEMVGLKPDRHKRKVES